MRKSKFMKTLCLLLCLSFLVTAFPLGVYATGVTESNAGGLDSKPTEMLALTNQTPFYGGVFKNDERIDDISQGLYGETGVGKTDFYHKGTPVTLEARCEEGCQFDEWQITDSDGITHYSKNKILHLTMDQSYIVVSLFSRKTVEGEPAITFDLTDYKKDPNDTELAGKMELYADPYYHCIDPYEFVPNGLTSAVDGQRYMYHKVKKGMYYMDDGMVAKQIFRNKNTVYLDRNAYNGITDTVVQGQTFHQVTAKISVGSQYKVLLVNKNLEPLILAGGTTGTYDFLITDTDSYGNPQPSAVITTNNHPGTTMEDIEMETPLYPLCIQLKQTGTSWTRLPTDYEIWIPMITPEFTDPDEYGIKIMPFTRNSPGTIQLEQYKTEDPALGGAAGKPVYSFGMSLIEGIVKKYEDQTETRDLKINPNLFLRLADAQGVISQPTGLSYVSKLVGEGTRFYAPDCYSMMHTVVPSARYVAKNQEAKTLNGVTGLTYDIYRLFYYFDLEIEGQIYTICQYLDLPYEGIKYGCTEKALALQRMYFDGAPEGVSKVTAVAPSAPVVKHNVTGTPEEVALADKMDAAIKNSKLPVASGKALISAALEKNKNITNAQAVEALKIINPAATGNTTKVVVRQYMDVQVNDIQDDTASGGSKTISVEITPMSQSIATNHDVADDAVITEGEGQNAVNIGQPETLTVNDPVTITLALPEGFANDGDIIYVKHTKSTGEEYIYEGIVSGGGTILTFVSEHGLSPFVVGVNEPVAQIGNTGYETLEKAIEVVDKFDSIKILKNVTLTNPIAINKEVALDMNGKTFTFDGDSGETALENGHISVTDGGNLLIKGNGIFDYNKQSPNYTLGISLIAKGNGKVYIENGTFNSKINCLKAMDTAQVSILGGTFNGDIALDNTAVTEISGGTFIKNKPANTMIKHGYKVVAEGENWVIVKRIAELAGYSITITDRIGVNFFMEFPTGVKNADYMVFTLPNGKSAKVPISKAVREADGKYRFTCPMAAKEMTDKIKVECYVNNKLEFTGEYSVEDYAKVIMKNEGNQFDAKTVEMVRTMLNYGAAAQLYFGYKTDTLANACLTEEQKQVPSATFGSYTFKPVTKENAIMGIEYAFSALDLDSTLGIKHYFTLNGDVPTYDYQISLLEGDGKAYGKKLPDTERGKFCIEILDIYPQNLDKTYKLQVSHSSGKIIVEYSPYTYACMVKNLPEGKMESLKKLMDAMDAYKVAAQSYISQNQGGN